MKHKQAKSTVTAYKREVGKHQFYKEKRSGKLPEHVLLALAYLDSKPEIVST